MSHEKSGTSLFNFSIISWLSELMESLDVNVLLWIYFFKGE